MPFQVLNKWNYLLDDFSSSQKDIYYREEYVKLYETALEKAICFFYYEGSDYFLFPYLLRKFNYQAICLYDFETPYGYGGPITNTLKNDFIDRALDSFYNYGKENNYVAGFVRFHPLLENINGFSQIGEILLDRKTIAIDLHLDLDHIWQNEIHTKNRNVIKKGLKNGLTFIADYNYSYLDVFMNLYKNTMSRLNADVFYYFDAEYFRNIKKNIENSFLGLVLFKEKVLASAIFFYSGIYGHYHLSGSDKDALNFSPNNFMLWEAAKEMKRYGVQKFHLGGGTDSDEHNSLYEFKKKFSKSEYSFYIGKIIFNPSLYEELCIEWQKKNPEKLIAYSHHLLKYKY